MKTALVALIVLISLSACKVEFQPGPAPAPAPEHAGDDKKDSDKEKKLSGARRDFNLEGLEDERMVLDLVEMTELEDAHFEIEYSTIDRYWYHLSNETLTVSPPIPGEQRIEYVAKDDDGNIILRGVITIRVESAY